MLREIKKIKYINENNFFLIAGPCAIESQEIAYEIAEKILNITNKLKIPFIFKGSFKKANRSRIDSFTGIGDVKALKILKDIGSTLDIPTITDIHRESDANLAAEYVDIIQIPAFLSRQTDLLIAAAKTGKTVNIKKGQFMSPQSVEHAINKIQMSGNDNILVTDRGTTFGYQDLIVDYRGISTMKKFNCPVILDVTHSLQQPNQNNGITGGNPEMIDTISKAAIAVGVDGIFL